MPRCRCAILVGCVLAACAAPGQVQLNLAEYRDKVHACWLGKSIGGTLGAPLEGRRETHELTFYDPLPSGQIANDDLDLQLLWLKALEEQGTRLTARQLGDYWLSYVPVNWNEYGVGKRNMAAGFPPPLSGQFRNEHWRDSNGAWIRSEIWACIAPGDPALAAHYAWQDACVDHGGGEGTYAELFTAALESAAFVEHDRDRLLEIGLSYIPPDCAVASSIRAAIAAHGQGLSLLEAREAVVRASSSTGWFMAPQNVAFTILGWLYGEDDFGQAICAAVNCGDDTDCTGATLGSLLGILHGTAGIPERWKEPIGEGLRHVAIAGFEPPHDLTELTERTVRMARLCLLEQRTPVALVDGPTRVPDGWSLVDADASKELWSRSPSVLTAATPALRAALDLRSDPVLTPGQPRELGLSLTNATPQPLTVRVAWRGDEGLTFADAQTSVAVPGHGETALAVQVTTVRRGRSDLRAVLELVPVGRPNALSIPFALALMPGVDPNDLALAAKGAKATSDSEYEREPGCTAKLIDGQIAGDDDFEGKRWHSALTPHPHWVAIELPEPQAIARCIVHFADPQGWPTDFTGEVSLDGQQWQRVFSEQGYRTSTHYEATFPALNAKYFRLTIQRSASPHWPDAAQVSEIELLPAT